MRRYLIVVAVAMLLPLAPAVPATATPPSGLYTLVFSDEFDVS